MQNLSTSTRILKTEEQLERSRWYGPNLLTFLAVADETGGAFSLIKCCLRKGFEPPLHVHSREDEAYVIIDGEINYEIGQETILARTGDYVHLPKNISHTFKLVSDTATILLLITPGGFEELFIKFSRPALALELPPVPAQPPGKDFFENMAKMNIELGVTMLPAF